MAFWTETEKEDFRERHPLVLPKMQYRHNHPHSDLREYFDAIFATDHPEYKGMVTVAARDSDGVLKTVAIVPADQMGVWASKMHISHRMDYYYSKSQHCGKATWGMDRVFAFNAIFVDIDAHGCAQASAKNLIDTICYALPDIGIPCPNIIENSGRGYHLIWLIEQVAVSLDWMVKKVTQHFSLSIHELLCAHNACGFNVDMSYASNISGLTRIPGSLNTVSQTYSDFCLLHDIRLDLPKMYDNIPAHTQNRKFSHATFSGTEVIGQQRVDALLRLSTIRSIQEGYRDIFSLHLFSAAQMAGMTTQNAMDLCKEINSSFDDPLPDRKIEQYLSTAAKKQYNFRTQRIIDDLQITLAEQDIIGLTPSKMRDSNRARRKRNASRKRNRDRKIMRLHMLGYSASAIAEATHHAYNTVQKTIGLYAQRLDTIFSLNEIRNIRKQRIRKAVSVLKAAFQNLKQYILCLYVRPCHPSSKYKVDLITLRYYNRGSAYNRKSVLLWLL